MIPLTILYDEYVGRPKLTEQKKTSWVYSSSLPTIKTIDFYRKRNFILYLSVLT